MKALFSPKQQDHFFIIIINIYEMLFADSAKKMEVHLTIIVFQSSLFMYCLFQMQKQNWMFK